ncbi:helix-turn-helix transcriptional regulator [Pendulispora brunnea]|uniref:Helix-turn-helix transcriptional regulator n=1 Tax=Pendulispora brunnea TaxID=2905690 RepID=A0ABZ2KF92_9BACT
MAGDIPKLAAPKALEAFMGTVGDVDVLVFRFPIENDRLPQGLSASERAVILGALAGKSNAEIARTRKSAARTVANQMASAFRKLGVSSRGELAARMLHGSSREMGGRP